MSQVKKAPAAAAPKAAAPKAAAPVPALPASAFEDLAPLPNAHSLNIRFNLRQRTKQETQALIKAETAAKGVKKAAGKPKKKFVAKKPTRDEKGVLTRLRKHDSTKAPAFEKSLGEKYSLKKKAAPAKK